MSILEAAAMGVPTIAFDCSPGVRSLVDGGRGFLVPPGDESEYTRVLATALADTDELARRGRTAHERVTSYFPDVVLEEWGRVLQQCYADLSSLPR